MESGDDSVLGERWQSGLYVAAGNDPFELVDSAVAAAAAISGDARPRVEKHLPPSLDVFGWCTWDAFYSRVSAQGDIHFPSMLCFLKLAVLPSVVRIYQHATAAGGLSSRQC